MATWKGQFVALKDVVGDMLDEGVFTLTAARQYLTQKLGERVGKRQELLVPNSDHNPVRPDYGLYGSTTSSTAGASYRRLRC